MDGIKTYQETTVTTQSKGQLVVMLYEGAIKFLKKAIEQLEKKDYAAKGNYINKAKDIISELNAVLDMEAAPEVAMNLRKLYLFMGRHLSEANTKKDPQKINEVISLLEELNKGWKAIV